MLRILWVELKKNNIDGSVQDCSNSIANALELLQSCTKPSISFVLLQDMQEKIDKICEMAAVMKRAILVDDEAVAREQQLVTQLKLENNSLRQLLHIASSNLAAVPLADAQCQTEADSDVEDASMDDIIDTMFDLDSSIISVKQMDLGPKEEPAEDPETPTQDNNNEDDSINSDTNSIDSQKLIESNSPAKRDSENNQTVAAEKTDAEKNATNKWTSLCQGYINCRKQKYNF